MSYDRALAELQDLLRRADLLKSWDQSSVYKVDDCLRVDFSARIAVCASAHAKPAGVDFTEAEVELTLEMGEGNSLEAIRRCSAQVVIDGINARGDILRFALHFDRHEPSLTATDLHAHYHWQVGGDLLDAQEFGTVLHLEGPRFPWHPLDPVLLVDFVSGALSRRQTYRAHGSGGLNTLSSHFICLANIVRRAVLHCASSGADHGPLCCDPILALTLRQARLISNAPSRAARPRIGYSASDITESSYRPWPIPPSAKMPCLAIQSKVSAWASLV